MSLLFFIILFVYITYWKRLQLVPQALVNPKKNLKPYNNQNLLTELKQTTSLSFEIKIQSSHQINGYMPGIPIKPVMVITQKALDDLTKDELSFLILHEVGHCINWHTLKDTILWITIFLVGIYATLFFFPTPILSSMFAIILAIIWIQIERRHEKEADLYALKKGAKKEAMISFFEKVNQQYQNPISQSKLLSLFFNPHPHFLKRIEMAKKFKG